MRIFAITLVFLGIFSPMIHQGIIIDQLRRDIKESRTREEGLLAEVNQLQYQIDILSKEITK